MQIDLCNSFIAEENFSPKAELRGPVYRELRLPFDVFRIRFIGGSRPEMSLEFEYRRLAAVCLDLSQRAGALADKTRLLLIAEAWLDLADRVARKCANAKRRSEVFEHPAINTGSSTGKTADAP
ncbi:MAG: hypothetical protein ACTHJS_03765 [Xanthobacteraceae bacterium]